MLSGSWFNTRIIDTWSTGPSGIAVYCEGSHAVSMADSHALPWALDLELLHPNVPTADFSQHAAFTVAPEVWDIGFGAPS